MKRSEKIKKVLEFADSQMLGVVASVNKNGQPEAALVAISETPNLDFIFGTANTSRKYKNIKNNPRVAVVLGYEVAEGITIQIEGLATEMVGDESSRCRDIHMKKNPRSVKYASRSDQRWFKIKPTWLRYTNLKEAQGEFEINFN
jgi:pyridoxine/pyridoxamine 5'-phosphate oxidase